MEERRVQKRTLKGKLGTRAVACVACSGAAALAIGMALIAMTAIVTLLAVLGVHSAPHTFGAAIQDAAVALYAVQLVGMSFFSHTAELRFAAIPGLLLLGSSIIAATAIAVRRLNGSPRRRLAIALSVSVPYALLMGFAALFVPLHFTATGFGTGVAVSPSAVGAFFLPLAWGVLFASLGGLIGVFGSDWRRVSSRLLGTWAAPLGSSLRVLAASMAVSAGIALVGGFAITGEHLGIVADGGLGHAARVVGAVLIALPTFAAAVLISGFGVPFGWQADALSHQTGSISAFGGTLPYSGSESPGILFLAPVVVLAAVLAIGWLSARRSGSNPRLCLANAARAAVLTTSAVWLLALLARVDAQAGGLLGLHFAPDGWALLWRVPLVTFAGCLIGSSAYLLTRGNASLRQLMALPAAAARSARRASTPGISSRLGGAAVQGLPWRAALGVSFAALPVMLVGMGATGTATSAEPAKVSLAPIAQAAEQRLQRASTKDDSIAVTVDPETRKLGTASVNTPLTALGISPGEPRAVKARDVLNHYGDLFGLSDPGGELGPAKTSTDKLGATHVSFTQMATGLPVFGGGIGVHLSQKNELLTFVSGSVIPEVSVAESKPELSSKQAIEVAEKALPSGRLAQPTGLQVYAGLPPYISGPNARLAWFVWLISDKNHASTEYVVDAVTGKILDTVSKGDFALDREVFDANEEPTLPGELVRKEGEGATGDEDVNNAYDHSGEVYEFYELIEERDSFDDNGATLESSAHFAEASGGPFENAFWNGKEVVFGNGFPAALDIVGHEWTHAYTQYTSGLIESGESGALNESISDIMGSAIETLFTEEVDWEIGANLPNKLGPIRSLSEPGKYSATVEPGETSPYPEELVEWFLTCLDSFGVHANSTITSHAFYLAVTNLNASPSVEEVVEVALLFHLGFTKYLEGNPTASLEDARAATLQAAKDFVGEESPAYEAIDEAFDEVGLNGEAQPTFKDCTKIVDCAFAQALQGRQGVSPSEAASMLTTLYKARGELAEPSAAGKHFLPLYQGHMGRISELVSEDPTLAETTVSGLAEITPALEALMEGEGDQFRLSKGEMAKIEAALKRLAQDDRLFEGAEAGKLADLIEEELQWLNLPSYSGKTYEAGWSRLNSEVEAQTLSEEGGPIIDPNCTGIANGGYPNSFQINGFYVDTPGHRIPGQVSPLDTGGVICGAEVEASEGKSGCFGEGSLNTSVTAQLPPGDEVNSSENLTNGSWVGEAVGRAIACAGNETQILYGQAGLLSMSSWNSSQCPETAISCYEGRSTYENSEGSVTGKTYAWVSEGEKEALSFTMRPVHVTTENGYEIQTSFGQFEVKLCGRAGSSATQECGGSGATWIHRNGEASEPGCPEGNGRFTAQAENLAEETTIPAYSCVQWDAGARMQTVGAPNSLEAVSCVPESTTCIAADSEGDAFYATNVSSASGASWNSWSGPEASPSEAVECPSTTLCLLAAGSVEGGGGNLYHASELGGSFLTSFKPSNGVGAISCPSTSFCVTGQTGGFIRYATNPSGIFWKAVSIGSGTMKDVSCLSASFCAVVDDSGNVHVATTEAKVKEAGGWTATNVNGEAALEAVACSSTSSCVAVDGSDEVLNLSIEEGGKAGAESQALDGAGGLTDVTCTGSDCVAVDDEGGVFASADSGATWQKSLATAGDVTSVSCASAELCASVDTSGDVAMFDPE